MRKEHFLEPKSQEKVWNEKWIFAEIKREIYEAENSPVIEILKKFLPPSGKILDAGCGLGGYLIWLKNNGYDAYGIDFSKDAISKLKMYDTSLKVKVANCENLPFPDDYFDVYISLGVMEHIEQGCEKFLKEAHRVLKKGGILLISVPYVNLYRGIKDFIIFKIIKKKFYFINTLEGDKHIIFYNKKFPKKLTNNFFQYYFTSKEIKNVVKKGGFEKIYMVPYSILPGLLEIEMLKKFYNKLILSRKKDFSESESKKSKAKQKKKKKREFLLLPLKRIYRLISWEKPENLIERISLRLFRILFGHMIFIGGRK